MTAKIRGEAEWFPWELLGQVIKDLSGRGGRALPTGGHLDYGVLGEGRIVGYETGGERVGILDEDVVRGACPGGEVPKAEGHDETGFREDSRGEDVAVFRMVAHLSDELLGGSWRWAWHGPSR